MNLVISGADKLVLRALAARVAELAQRPIEARKRALWIAHNDLKTSEPVVFIDPENGWKEIITEGMLECEGKLARMWENQLRKTIFHGERLKDDMVIDAEFCVSHEYREGSWGVELKHVGGENDGAYGIQQVIEDYEEDFGKIVYPELIIDFERSRVMLELAHEVFDGVLEVRQYTSWWWSMSPTRPFIHLRGLEEFMCDFILEPEWVHRMMELLCKGALDTMDFLEEKGLLCLNTGNRYVGSGGFGFTDELPKMGEMEGVVRTMDMWGFEESQETVSVSPEMYGEFVLPYHRRIAERFGLNCYGCCEPYDGRWRYAKTLPRLRRISCSPWSDRRRTEEFLGMRYIASHKLIPTPLARPKMDEDEVRAQLREAVESSRGCVPELIMKDNHTLGGNPENAVRWVEIAREEIAKL